MSNIGDFKKQTGDWWVYVALCNDGTLYTGCTTDLARREDQHNGVRSGGAKYTAPRRPIKIISQLSCANRSEAQRLESMIKKMSRKEKLAWCDAHKRVIDA
jgi:putative endonuclease